MMNKSPKQLKWEAKWAWLIGTNEVGSPPIRS